MAAEQALGLSLESVVEDVLQQHGTRLSDRDLASRKAEEASSRRYEAAGWLRRTVGVVGGKDLPAEPSEEEFRLGLRSGIILCNVLNKVQPGAVPKVVEGPSDSVVIPDGAALSAYQYFENVRNFLVAIEEMGLPTFEASDLAQGGKSARIVNSVLALKDYSDWKQAGGIGTWKFGGNSKPSTSAKPFVRKNSEPFMNSFSQIASSSEQSLNGDSSNDEATTSGTLSVLLRRILSDKKQDEIPIIVESMLGKVMEEFEHRLASRNGVVSSGHQMKAEQERLAVSPSKPLSTKSSLEDLKAAALQTEETEDGEENPATESIEEHGEQKPQEQKFHYDDQLMGQTVKHQNFVKQHQKHIQELKQSLSLTKAEMQFLQMKYLEDFDHIGKQMYGLANAASGYQRVLEENRRLYNQVQDLKGNIRVYCRVRPLHPSQQNSASPVTHIDDGNITILSSSKYGKEGKKSFTFNRVFSPSATQAEVFADTQPLVRSVLDGYNVCIFAYGQTGSGKTHTMSGPKELTEETMGVNYRALSDLFMISKQRRETIAYDIFVQMIEIYNEQVRDLLVMDGSIKRLEIRNSFQNGINVPDANLVPVSTTSDVIQLMNLGHRNRAVSSTAMNDRSSRSHSCLTVHVQGKELTSGTILRGCMHLVDLAGSERVDKSEVVGDRLKEAQHINKSLSALGDVIASLAQKNSHVPYRNSKLTQLLQDSLGGQAKTLMFVHIAPEYDALGETISTLKFAERVSSVELGAAKVNKDSSEVKDLKEQIASLRAALARKEAEGESRSSSPERSGIKSAGSSSSNLSWPSMISPSPTHRQPEDVANGEAVVQNQSVSKPKRRSLDPQDLLANSPPWPPLGSPVLSRKEDDKESVSGEWVDKVMVKSGVENRPVTWEVADNNKSEIPRMFYNGFTPDHSKIYPENQQLNVQRSRYDVDHESDDLDAATSDSSESSTYAAKVAKSAVGPKNTRKPQPKTAKSTETRSMIPSLIPNPTKKAPNGVTRPRPAGSHDGRRRGK